MSVIFPIVEGHGEVEAVPILLRRVLHEICSRYDVEISQPYRLPRGRIVSADTSFLVKSVELGARKIAQANGRGLVMVLLDADKECPARLAPDLLSRIARPDIPTAVVIAKQEYEAWFLASVISLRENRNVRSTAMPQTRPEDIEDPKKYLARHVLKEEHSYRETVDQPALTAGLDLPSTRSASPSFDKLCRDIEKLLP